MKRPTSRRSVTVGKRLSLGVLSVLLVGNVVGCDEAPNQVDTNFSEAQQPEGDPLADLLQLVEQGQTDAAVEELLSYRDEALIEATAVESFQLSEAEFGALPRAEQTSMQERFIERARQIKTLARAAMERARQAAEEGDQETADGYVAAVNRLGERLRDADVVLVYQQTGKALAGITLEEWMSR